MLDEPARQPILNVPAVVIGLLALLALIHMVLAFLLSTEQVNDLLLTFAFIPARYSAKALGNVVLPGGWGADIWTFVTYALLHSNLNHLIFNGVWLLAFGTPVARRFGTLRFLIFLAVAAVAGAAVHLATNFGEKQLMIGASAAVSGAMGAAIRFVFTRNGPLGLFGRREDIYRVPAAPLTAALRDGRVLAFVLVWFGLTLVFGLGPFAMGGVQQAVAWEAHIGGFLVGLLAFAAFDPVRAASQPGSDEGADLPPNRE
jgi:membrane associated rhomboid family serine protease